MSVNMTLCGRVGTAKVAPRPDDHRGDERGGAGTDVHDGSAAKSSAPSLCSQPSVAQTQCASGS